MKKYLVAALVLSMAIVSCKKDDGDDTSNNTTTNNTVDNKFTFDGTTYTMQTGTAEDYGYDSTNNAYNFDFNVSSDELTFNNGFPSPVNSNDSVIDLLVYCELFSEGATFSTGTYTFCNGTSCMGNYFITSEVAKNFDLATFTSEADFGVTGGTIKVEGTSPNYTITYNVTTDQNKTLTGAFKKAFIVL